MDIKKLKYFVTLVEEGNFSKAAKVLYITQPALSWNIKELEETLGTQLIKRSSTGIEVTDAGNILYDGAKSIINDLNNLHRSIKHSMELQRRRVRCGMTILSSIEYMSIFQYFSNTYPEYRLEYIQRGSKEIQQMVTNGQIEIGLVSEPIYYPTLNTSGKNLDDYYYEVAVVIRKDHPLADRESLTLKDLEGQPLGMMTESFAMGNEMERRFNELAIVPNVVFRNENWEVLVEHAVAYNSVTFLPFPIKDVMKRNDIVWIPLIDAKVSRFDLVLVTSLDLKDVENKLIFDRFYEALISTNSNN